MPEQNTTTKSEGLSKRELQNEVRRLTLELQGYRVFGTPMEIAIRLQYQPPTCYWCNFQITNRAQCDIIQYGIETYHFHHECLDPGVNLLAEINHKRYNTILNKRNIGKLKDSATRYDS